MRQRTREKEGEEENEEEKEEEGLALYGITGRLHDEGGSQGGIGAG